MEELSIIAAAYNEEKRILKCIDKICEFIDNSGLSCHVYLIDDGSTDQTLQIARAKTDKLKSKFTISSYKLNKGKFHALKTGFLLAKGKYVLMTDVDLSAPISQYELLLENLVKYDAHCVIASRSMGLSKLPVPQPSYRRISGRIFSVVVSMLHGLKFKDTQCGFKLFKRDKFEEIFSRLRISGFSGDVEILYLAKKLSLKIREVPVEWSDSPGSKVSLGSHGLHMFFELFCIKWYDSVGLYNIKKSKD